MLVAAYLVGGFLVASVYAVALLRGKRDRYHRLGFLIPFTVAAIVTPVQMVVGDQLARLGLRERADQVRGDRAGARDQQRRARDACGRFLERAARSSAGIAIPGLASILSDPARGTATVIQGLDTLPGGRAAHDPPGQHRPPGVGHDGRPRHRAVPARGLVRDRVARASGTSRRSKWFLRAAAVIAASRRSSRWRPGWVVTEVGRQPWIVFDYMKVERGRDREPGRVDHLPRRSPGCTRSWR